MGAERVRASAAIETPIRAADEASGASPPAPARDDYVMEQGQ